MKGRRPGRRGRSLWLRIAGYTGTLALVAAAVIVLLMPLMDEGTKGAAGFGGTAAPSAPGGVTGLPGGVGLPVTPTDPAPQQNRSGQPYPGSGGSGGQSGGPQIPPQNGSSGGVGACPKGTASYRATPTGVDVVVAVSASGAIRAELSLRGREPTAQQRTVRSGGPQTFHFTGVAPQLVERVKVTTISVGGGMENCYARPA
ncbi:hypothetical protein BKA00_001322 [Actinomadura coerulea]|uniref:Uncharacterized protein n=1 Tax=Actinomadura coerulea TaxID=46159 RepID=A0A7X0FVE6_9ACTN|nr:hypothetical protein [Actinomadura coerulea]MBB6394408.1 hypothetical protein [Actinomadura coerulea]GGQ40787.1 hypothetical protein GCM10010187_68620 [Actinomadura coerulea]